MTSKIACLPCRTRKVRCIPSTPRCQRCTVMGIENCVYNPERKKTKALRTGMACIPCRTKKKKCDSNRPCAACIDAGLEQDCTRDTRASPPTSLVPLRPSFQPPKLTFPPLWPNASTEALRLESFLGPHNMRVAGTTDGDRDMKLRLASICNLRTLGVYLRQEKLDAILLGDLSNPAVHPAVIHLMQCLGAYYSQVELSPLAVRMQAVHAQKLWEDVADILRGNDCELKIHVGYLIATSYLFLRMTQGAKLFLWKCTTLVNNTGTRFLPAYGRPPELSEDLRENVTFLSQIIYLDNYLFMAFDGPSPKRTARIEKEFTHELREAYPVLFDICPLIMRTEGILLVRDAALLLKFYASSEGEVDRETCDRLIWLLEEYTATRLQNRHHFLKIGDDVGGTLIASACIPCLASLAALCHLMTQIEPAATTRDGMDQLCDSALSSLTAVTQDADIEEYTYYDLLLEMSWRESLQIFDARINALSPVEREPLQRSRDIVSQAHLDLKNNIPECTPPKLMLLAFLEDGRTATSRYPNLFLPAERARANLL